jgi:hypothetical protein
MKVSVYLDNISLLEKTILFLADILLKLENYDLAFSYYNQAVLYLNVILKRIAGGCSKRYYTKICGLVGTARVIILILYLKVCF